MAGHISGSEDEPISQINIVPFVDIVLVVLIIFMVTAPLVLKPSIDINLPKASTGDESPTTPLNITVARDGQVLLNGKVSSMEDITVYTTQLVQTQPETAAILAADKDVTLERLTEQH